MTTVALFAFLLVFVRCSAMLLASPVFGAQTTPVHIRVLTTFAIAGSLCVVVQPHMGPIPSNLGALAVAILHEALAGILIGSMMNLALQCAQIAGSVMDMQVGLGMSQSMNPVSGISSTVLSQFKFMLSVVVFLCANAHHLLLRALVQSYTALPLDINLLERNLVGLLTNVVLIAMQIAAPVMAVGFLVDATLGLLNRAVSQMPAAQMGPPIKIGVGLMAISMGLPALVAGTTHAIGLAWTAMQPLLGK